jgi:hypothetical protein
MSHIKDDKKKKQKSLRPYRKPHLQAYGTVKDLTAGGSKGTRELTGGDPIKRRP